MSQCDTNVNDPKTTFYERLIACKGNDETQEEFAQRIRVTPETLRHWAQGATPILPGLYVALAEILECSAAWLYAGRRGIKPGNEDGGKVDGKLDSQIPIDGIGKPNTTTNSEVKS